MLRRLEVGLADLEVDHVPPGRLERPGPREHRERALGAEAPDRLRRRVGLIVAATLHRAAVLDWEMSVRRRPDDTQRTGGDDPRRDRLVERGPRPARADGNPRNPGRSAGRSSPSSRPARRPRCSTGALGFCSSLRSLGWTGVAVVAALALSSGTFLLALNYTTVANVLFLMATAPVFAALLGWAVLGERIAPRTWLAMALAAGGVSAMVAGTLEAGFLAVAFRS